MTTTSRPMPLFSHDWMNTYFALLLIMIAILAGLIGYGLNDYGLASDASMLDVQRYAVQLGAVQATGQIQADFAWTEAFRQWTTMETFAQLADDFDNPTLAQAYASILQETIQPLSPLLNPPYFDPQTDEIPDITAYEAQTYIRQQAIISQQFARAQHTKSLWDDKGDTFITLQATLGLIAVLLGLVESLVNHRSARRALLVFSTLVIFYVGFTSTTVALQPVQTLSDQAITHYADGVALAYQQDYEQAITAYDQAITLVQNDGLSPYLDAYVERAFAYTDWYFQTYDTTYLDRAITDYNTILDNGRFDAEIFIQLDYLYFIQGDFARAEATSRFARQQSPDVAHLYDHARSLFALGRVQEAQDLYREAITTTAQRVAQARALGQFATPSILQTMTYAFYEMNELRDCIRLPDCALVPVDSLQALRDAPDAENIARDIAISIKNALTQLEISGTLKSGSTPQPITLELDSDAILDDSDGILTISTNAFFLDVYFPTQSFNIGQNILLKVYQGNQEYYPLRQTFIWTEQASQNNNDLLFSIIPPAEPDFYNLQVFLDEQLVGEAYVYLVEE